MTWIKTTPMTEAGEKLRAALEAQAALYPPEYAAPVETIVTSAEREQGAGIVMSHSLLPDALHHAFATFGVLMSPDLPLKRRHHEMIAATVSALNRCYY